MNAIRTGRVGVIGGGLGGLAAACTLAARGYSVVLLEKNDWLGGKAAVLEEAGYRFDMGPTILTMPSVLARIFAEAGRCMEDYLELIRIDPQWRSFFSDQTTLDLRADVNDMGAALEAFSPGSGSGYQRFIQHSARLHRISDRFFFWRPVGGMKDMFDIKTSVQPALLGDLLAMNLGRSVAATVRSHVSDARVAQMLDHFTQYVGSAPDSSPAVLCSIAHMQVSEGVWYPQGGTGAIPRALARLATELGVEIRHGTGVKRIHLTKDGGVAGVEMDSGEQIRLDAVISNADSVRTHRELLGGKPAARFERRRRYEPACSGVVLYLGLDRQYDQLLHHNFVFSRDPEEEFDFIYRRGEPAPDPTCYVCAPARTEPGVSPPGGEALYVLVHTPYLRPHHDWKRLFPAYRKTILEKLSQTAGLKNIADHIRFERALTPVGIQDRYGVPNGAIYGLASHGRFLGAFKPSNRSPDVPRLYLAGGAAHPGPGMPMVLMSGWIAADALDRDGLMAPKDGAKAQGLSPDSVQSTKLGRLSSLTNPGIPVQEPPAVLKSHSPMLFRMFTRHVKRFYLARNFHAVRLSKQSASFPSSDGPLIIVVNHPSWWDPLICFTLADRFQDRTHFTPMDAAALNRYRIFGRMGVFGIEMGTLRGARDFLRTSSSVLNKPGTALWVAAQGKFADVRQRPPRVQPGVAHLASQLDSGVILPLALEYTFWDERYPEALARFGHPIQIQDGSRRSVEEWRIHIDEALANTQNDLAVQAQGRDAAAFETLVSGVAGIGGVYDWWRWLKSKFTGEQFQSEHSPEAILPVPEVRA